MNFDYLKDPTSITTLATIALVVGGIVRVLKTEKVQTILDWIPLTKRIPKDYLPWVAVALGMVITALDAKLNAGLTWKQAGLAALAGVLAGGTAVGGHETIAKLLGKVMTPPSDRKTPPDPTKRYSKPDAETESPPPMRSAPAWTWPFRLAAAAVMVVSIVVTGTGCGAVAAALPHIIAAIVDGGQIIDRIADYLAKWFALHPDPIIQPKVELAIQKCRKALSIALHAAEGTDKLDQAKVDAAFDDFKKAYLELIELARPYGVNTEGQHAFKASPDGQLLVVPEPLALKPVPR